MLRAAMLFLLVAVLSAVVPLVENAAVYSMVLAMFACWALPMWFQWHRGTLDFFEPIHAFGGLYFVYFGLGAVWTLQDPSNVAYDLYIVPFIPAATLVCLLGYLTMLAGYYGPFVGRRVARPEEEYPSGALFLLVPAALGFLGFVAQMLWYRATKLGITLAGLISSLGQLSPLFVFAWSLAWLLLLSRRATRAQTVVLIVLLMPAAGIIVVNSLNNKSMIISLAGVPLVALWYARRKIPWLTLSVLLLVVVFVIFPFNNTYRQLDQRISTGQRLAMTSMIIGKWDTQQYLSRSVGTFKERMALINSVAVVIRDVPRWVPYAEGETIFLPMAMLIVPRVLWPDKPMMTFGRQFGETFRVVHYLDHETKIAATVPGELYWNFSAPGVLLGLAVFGLALRLYYRRYAESAGLDPVRRAIHVALLVQVLHFEAGIAGPAVVVIRTLLVLEAYRMLSRRFHLVEPVRRVPAGAVTARAD